MVSLLRTFRIPMMIVMIGAAMLLAKCDDTGTDTDPYISDDSGPVQAVSAASAVSVGSKTFISATPDTGDTVYLDPGESQTFEVVMKPVNETKNRMVFEDWYITDVATGEDITNTAYNNDEIYSEWLTDSDGNTQVKVTYAPGPESAGKYKVTIMRGHRYYPFGRDTTTTPKPYITLRTEKKTWTIQVTGIDITPDLNVTSTPGTKQSFKATAYPSGTYSYHWYLDGVSAATTQTYKFTPTAAMCGTHTLSVSATRSGVTMNASRNIIIPFAKISGDGEIFIESIARTSDGGYVAAGYTDSTDISGASEQGGFDALVIKLDASGKVVWQKLYGGSDNDYACSVAQIDGGGYAVAGYSASTDIDGAENGGWIDGYALKLDASGNVVWQKLFGDTGSDRFVSVAVDSGIFVFAGLSSTYINQVMGKPDIIVTALDANGNTLWDESYGGAGADQAKDLLALDSGGYLVAGGSTSKDLTGTTPTPGELISDAYLLAIDGDGSLASNSLYNLGSSYSYFTSVIPAGDGGFVAAGIYDYYSASVFRLGVYGSPLWKYRYNNGDTQQINAVIEASSGGYRVFGQSRTSGNGYILAIDGNGIQTGQAAIAIRGYKNYIRDAVNAGTGKIMAADNVYTSTDQDAYLLLLDENVTQ